MGYQSRWPGGRSQDDTEKIASPEMAKPTRPDRKEQLVSTIAEYAILVPASMFGVLARLGLVALSQYDGKIIFPLAWAQGVGCAIMGTIMIWKADVNRVYPPLYTSIATGLAGSITTFSSWMLEGYESFADLGGYQRGGLHDTVDGLAYNFVTAAIAVAALSFGKHCSQNLYSWYTSSRRSRSDSLSKDEAKAQPSSDSSLSAYTRAYHMISIAFGILFYAGALLLYFLGPRSWRHPVTFALLLGPPGTMIRFALAKLNTRPAFEGKFPVGTFLANMLATAILAAVFVGQRAPGKGGRTVSLDGTTCNALYAIEEGFCGCLSTVSTFAVEMRSIKARWKWIYVGASILTGHLIVLAIVGGVSWSSAGLGPSCG